MKRSKSVAIGLALAFALLLAVYTAWERGYIVWAEKEEEEEPAELTKALKEATVSLETGLSVSEREGTPVSGKFEAEEGRLQLSVFTVKDDKFSEVIVDPNTGKIAKVESIASGEDLAAAKVEGEAMAQAKRSLRAAVEEAVALNVDYRAVSVAPSLKHGHPVAAVTLVKGEQSKRVSEKLD